MKTKEDFVEMWECGRFPGLHLRIIVCWVSVGFKGTLINFDD